LKTSNKFNQLLDKNQVCLHNKVERSTKDKA